MSDDVIHLPIGGSNISRRLKCYGSKDLESRAPKKEAGAPADIGTLVHDCVLERYYDQGVEIEELVGKVSYKGHVFDETLLTEMAIPAINHIDFYFETYDIEYVWFEKFVEYIPGLAGGSADFFGLSADEKTLMIGDLKTGRVPVNPEENEQELFYALCLQHTEEYKYLFETVEKLVLVIIQPTGQSGAWETDLKRLKQFQDQVDLMLGSDSHLAPGDHCRYCKAASICPEKIGQARQALRMNTSDTAQLAGAMALAVDLKQWIKDVEADVQAQIEAGNAVDGWTLAPTRPTEKYIDEKNALKTLAKHFEIAKITDTKILSPAQMRKMAKSQGIDFDEFKLTEKVSGGVKVVKGSSENLVNASNLRASMLAFN